MSSIAVINAGSSSLKFAVFDAKPEPSLRLKGLIFVYRAQHEIGSLAAALGSLDALVFTGGIGENDVDARAEICIGSQWLGITLNSEANQRADLKISAAESRVTVMVIPTNEELEMARSAFHIVGGVR